MRIKQMLCTLLISIGIANADELDSLYMNYISAGGKITPEISEILKKDIYYQKALDEMKNPKDTKNEIKDAAKTAKEVIKIIKEEEMLYGIGEKTQESERN